MSGAAIRCENLKRYFGTVKAVDGLSFEVPAGIIFGFLGPNGSGKTTTISLLLGLLEPTDGKAEVLGFDTRKQPDEIRARTGALLEYPGIYEQMSAEDNLEFFGRVWRMPAAKRQARIRELLEQIGLWQRRSERVVKWSRGMKQRLALARALLHQPPLLFLDEPTAGLDVIAAVEIRENLAKLVANQGVTVFLTTHNMAEAEKVCQRVAVIRQGRVVATGAPDELRAGAGGSQVEISGSGFSDEIVQRLKTQPEVAAVEMHNGHLLIHLRGDMDTAPLVSLLVTSGARVEEVRKGKASLEEVFMALMEEDKDAH